MPTITYIRGCVAVVRLIYVFMHTYIAYMHMFVAMPPCQHSSIVGFLFVQQQTQTAQTQHRVYDGQACAFCTHPYEHKQGRLHVDLFKFTTGQIFCSTATCFCWMIVIS